MLPLMPVPAGRGAVSTLNAFPAPYGPVAGRPRHNTNEEMIPPSARVPDGGEG